MKRQSYTEDRLGIGFSWRMTACNSILQGGLVDFCPLSVRADCSRGHPWCGGVHNLSRAETVRHKAVEMDDVLLCSSATHCSLVGLGPGRTSHAHNRRVCALMFSINIHLRPVDVRMTYCRIRTYGRLWRQCDALQPNSIWPANQGPRPRRHLRRPVKPTEIIRGASQATTETTSCVESRLIAYSFIYRIINSRSLTITDAYIWKLPDEKYTSTAPATVHTERILQLIRVFQSKLRYIWSHSQF